MSTNPGIGEIVFYLIGLFFAFIIFLAIIRIFTIDKTLREILGLLKEKTK